MSTDSLLLVVCILFASCNIYYSVNYIIKVKSFWRYIKISYIFSNLFLLVIYTQMLFGHSVSDGTRFLAALFLLASMTAGLITSREKIKVAERIDSLEIRWETRQQNSQ